MLNHQTMEHLIALRLEGMAQALEEQRRQADISQLAYEERFGLLVQIFGNGVGVMDQEMKRKRNGNLIAWGAENG